MSESEPRRRPGGPGQGGRSAAGRDATGRPRSGERRGRPAPKDAREAAPRAAGRFPAGERGRRPRADELALPPDVTPDQLDRAVWGELRSLPKQLAERVAGHLVAAGTLIDTDPALASRHAMEARRLAARVAAVREAAGLTAYAAGRYAEALTELRAARRLADNPDVLPVMADCERGLGRPERALALLDHADARRLDRAGRVELLIVAAGARRDLGQPDAAVLTLEVPELHSGEAAEWTERLWYAYADALLAAGRRDEAIGWFEAVAAVDEDELTDAAERVEQLRSGPDADA
ncbi:MAG: hypothetical protein ACJ74O_07235 [Frankiaceae bacterium]